MPHANRTPSISFEFFPPATAEMAYRLWSSAMTLRGLAPDFVSVTYGAGGSARQRSLDAIAALIRNAGLDVAGHLTCVDDSRDGVMKVARAYEQLGVRAIVALRGDPPKGADGFRPKPDGFGSSLELIETLKRDLSMKIIVGCYPEKHPEAADAAADVHWLKKKQDAGADMAITQFFFDNEIFYRFRDAATKAGVTIPIVPGVLPIDDFDRMKGFAARCGASVPARLEKFFDAVKSRPEAERAEAYTIMASGLCAEQAQDLIDAGGVDRLHFYTLNKPELPYNVCRALGVEPRPLALAACG